MKFKCPECGRELFKIEIEEYKGYSVIATATYDGDTSVEPVHEIVIKFYTIKCAWCGAKVLHFRETDNVS